MIITVYSKSECPQCDQTKRLLKLWDIPFHEVDAEDPSVASELKRLYGYSSAPVVLVSAETGRITDHWSGFRDSKLRALKAELRK